jgi:hypothetical protein
MNESKSNVPRSRSSKIDLGFSHISLPDEDVDKWCKLYGLNIRSAPCIDCGKILVCNVTIASKTKRGLRAEPCECGNYDVPFQFVAISKDDPFSMLYNFYL